MLTPVNEKTAAEDLEKLREEMVKQVSALQQQRAEVLDLIQDAKAENEKATARKNLFTVTPAAKPPRRSSLQDVEPKKYKSLLKGLASNWNQRRKGWTKTETLCCVRLC